MSFSCIIINPDPITSPRISTFLRQSQTLEIKGRFSLVSRALASSVTAKVDYILVDMTVAQELLSALRKKDPERRVNIIIFGPEQSYFLENALANPNLFLEDTMFSQSSSFDWKSISGSLIAPEEFEIPNSMSDIFSLAKKENKPVWILLPNGHWNFQTHDPHPANLYVRTETGIKRLRLGELLAIEAQRDYLLLHTAQGSYRLLRSLKKMESLLDPKIHFRIHRSFIVHVPSIHTIDESNLWLDGLKEPIPIGPSFRKELLNRLEIL